MICMLLLTMLEAKVVLWLLQPELQFVRLLLLPTLMAVLLLMLLLEQRLPFALVLSFLTVFLLLLQLPGDSNGSLDEVGHRMSEEIGAKVAHPQRAVLPQVGVDVVVIPMGRGRPPKDLPEGFHATAKTPAPTAVLVEDVVQWVERTALAFAFAGVIAAVVDVSRVRSRVVDVFHVGEVSPVEGGVVGVRRVGGRRGIMLHAMIVIVLRAITTIRRLIAGIVLPFVLRFVLVSVPRLHPGFHFWSWTCGRGRKSGLNWICCDCD